MNFHCLPALCGSVFNTTVSIILKSSESMLYFLIIMSSIAGRYKLQNYYFYFLYSKPTTTPTYLVMLQNVFSQFPTRAHLKIDNLFGYQIKKVVLHRHVIWCIYYRIQQRPRANMWRYKRLNSRFLYFASSFFIWQR